MSQPGAIQPQSLNVQERYAGPPWRYAWVQPNLLGQVCVLVEDAEVVVGVGGHAVEVSHGDQGAASGDNVTGPQCRSWSTVVVAMIVTGSPLWVPSFGSPG